MMSHERTSKMVAEADWKDGINAFRNQINDRLAVLEEKLTMIMERISWLEEPPKAPHDKKEEELKLWACQGKITLI